MPQPSLALEPTSGHPGAKILAVGRDFPTNLTVRIDAGGHSVAHATAGATGQFEVSLIIPAAPAGNLAIKAYGPAAHAQALFTVLPRPAPPPYARIEPARIRTPRGSTAFFDGGYSTTRAKGAQITKWRWEGPAGQTSAERAFRVDTEHLQVGRHLVTLTVTDSNEKLHKRAAVLWVSKARPRPKLQRANLIQDIQIDKPKIRSGEYFRLEVKAKHPTNSAERVDVEIHGRWGSSRVLQIKGNPGKRRIRIAARTKEHYDVRRFDVEVVRGKATGCFVDFYVSADPQHKHRAVFQIFDAVPPGSHPTLYHWEFGDGQTATTTTPSVAHDYTNSVSSDLPYTVVQATVREPQAGLIGRKTVTLWNPALSKLKLGIESEHPSPIPPPALDVDQPERIAWALSGGGAKGAFQAGVVRYLDQIGIVPHIITGTSVGALNAAKLAEGNPAGQPHAAEALVDLWRAIGGNEDIFEKIEETKDLEDELDDLNIPDVFDFVYWVATGPAGLAIDYLDELEDAKGVLSALSRVHSLFDQKGLRNMIAENLNPDLVRQSGIELRVAAAELDTGNLHYFTGDGAVLDKGFREIERPGSVDLGMAILASSAIPALFKRVRFLGRTYVDGAIREDVPLLAALDLNPSIVYVINTFPDRFQAAQLAPLELLEEVEAPKALDFLMQSIEIMADEVAQDDFREHRRINSILREVFAERDANLPDNLLVRATSPDDPPLLAPRALHSYPLGRRPGVGPMTVERVVPTIKVIAPPWNLGGVTDFYPWALAAYLELGEKVAELSMTEIPGGLSLSEATCDFVVERLAECTSEFAAFSNACYVWAGWAYNYCGGPDPYPSADWWNY